MSGTSRPKYCDILVHLCYIHFHCSGKLVYCSIGSISWYVCWYKAINDGKLQCQFYAMHINPCKTHAEVEKIVEQPSKRLRKFLGLRFVTSKFEEKPLTRVS